MATVPTAPTAPTAAQLSAANNAARAAILQSGVFLQKRVGTINFTELGVENELNLENVGMTTKVVLRVVASINVTAAMTPSDLSPWNFIRRITYQDYNGKDRTFGNGTFFAIQEAARNLRIPGVVSATAGINTVGAVDTNQLTVPTAVGTANLEFFLEVPIAINAEGGDFRGAVLSQVAQSNQKIKVQLATALVGGPVHQPYTAGTATLVSCSVEVYQHYVMPPSNNGVAVLPILDLAWIYGLQGNYGSNSIVNADSPYYINYPTNRTILSASIIFEDGGVLTPNQTDVQFIKRIVNSNTTEREWTPAYLRSQMRQIFNGDLPSGVYYFGTRARPIQTVETGNVQLEFLIGSLNAASGGNTNFYSAFEMVYPTGMALTGIATNGG